MPEMSAYGDGVPSWIDMASPDVEASKAFYTALFGWQANPVPVPDAGGYTLFTLDGKQVAGVGAIMSSDQPPAWMTYINVSDADGVAKKVGDAGGSVLMAPMDIIHQGRMAVFADTAGAVLGLWQPAEHMGAQLVNEPGAYSWSEFKLNGNSIAGMFNMADMMPADTPPHWGVYVAVADCDATVDAATRLGASVIAPAMDVPVGRFAVLQDPQGAVIRVIRLAGHA